MWKVKSIITADPKTTVGVGMEGAEEELERRSKFLSSLIQKKKAADEQKQQVKVKAKNVRVRASDMPIAMQNKALMCTSSNYYLPPGNGNVNKIDTKRLAFALKKEFDGSYGPAWQCIVGSSFGSFVTHSSGGFMFFSIDKLHVLLFKTKVGLS